MGIKTKYEYKENNEINISKLTNTLSRTIIAVTIWTCTCVSTGIIGAIPTHTNIFCIDTFIVIWIMKQENMDVNILNCTQRLFDGYTKTIWWKHKDYLIVLQYFNKNKILSKINGIITKIHIKHYIYTIIFWNKTTTNYLPWIISDQDYTPSC